MIFLNIEIVGNNFESGALGPGTIVGSAAFNLMGISAACILAIPGVESRKIKGYSLRALCCNFRPQCIFFFFFS